MSLINDFMEACVLVEKTRVPDGEGGFTTSWQEGAQFEAAITFDGSMQARTAEKQVVSSSYTVTTRRNVHLKYHDVIKRLSDGKILRITSDGDDVVTPARASFSFSQVTAEEWILP